MWHFASDLRVDLIESSSSRICVLSFCGVNWKLLIINTYEGTSDNTSEFVYQLSTIESNTEKHQDFRVIVCSDCNVDFSRNWYHAELLNDFCECMDMLPLMQHDRCTADYTYSFDNC